MPEYKCYLCGRELTRENLNDKGDGFICPDCTWGDEEVVTFLEPKDNGKLGIRKVFLR